MVAYSIDVIPMIKKLKAAYPDVTQPCSTDDVGALGTYKNIELYFNLQKKIGPGSGYYPEHSESVLTIHLDNI